MPGRARRGPALALIAAVLVLLAGLLPSLALISRDAWLAVASPGPASLDSLVIALTGPIALAAAAWLLIAVLASTAEALLARAGQGSWSCAAAVAPPLVRYGIAGLLGVVLLSSPAAASTQSSPVLRRAGAAPVLTAPSSPGAALQGWLPELPAQGAAPPARSSTGSGREAGPAASTGSVRSPGAGLDAVTSTGRHRRLEADDAVVVHRGDTLWAIAARSLGPQASHAQIAQEWPRWFSANRAEIGPDPGQLAPGQRLRPPAVHRGPTGGAESPSRTPRASGDVR